MNLTRLSLAFTLAAALSFGTARAQTADPVAQASAVPEPVPSAAPSAPVPLALPSGLRGLANGLPNLLGQSGPQAYGTFVKSAERQSGLIDILHKDDEVYLDLLSSQFGKQFVIAPVLAAGVGEEAFAGRIFNPFVLEFKRVGKRILWISKNTRFAAPANTSAANALDISVADAVINSTPIVAEDESKDHVVVSASFFLSDFENIGRDLMGGGGGGGGAVLLFGGPQRQPFAVDATRSYLEKTKALPKNDELLANLAFVGQGSIGGAAADSRGVRIRMHYSIVEMPPADGYVPRYADDRVGYFVNAIKTFDNDTLPSPYQRYIARWNFAKGPLVYYLTDEIPAQYKPAIKSALLEWNNAFAKAGIPNAIEVRNQPSDPAWDPDDVRYSTVRWITSDRPGFSAYGPHIANPLTGEIMRVEIVIDGESMRSIKRGYVDQVAPTRNLATQALATALASGGAPGLALAQLGPQAASFAPLAALAGYGGPAFSANSSCEAYDCDDFEESSAQMAATGVLALRSQGASSQSVEKYAEDWLRSVVLHEAGHNFGLRHNFAAPIHTLAQLHDKNFTATHGLVNSVMHYTPLNLSPPGKPQGDYFQEMLGPYDYWAIDYGYAKVANAQTPDDELPALKKIADRSTDPQLVYATDEDTIGPRAIDPVVAPYRLSSDSFAYYTNQFNVVDDLVSKLDRAYPRDDRSYADERAAFLSTMRSASRAALLDAKYIGGEYTSRSHRGQPGGVAPFRPVGREDQRRAFELLDANVFSAKAWRFSPQLLSDLGSDNFLSQGYLSRPDFAVSDFVSSFQDSVMAELFSPDVMSRIDDMQFKTMHPGETMTLDDLFGWMQNAAFDDVRAGRAIDPTRRALQRRYTALLTSFALAPSFLLDAFGYPGDAAPLARYQLQQLDARLGAALAVRGGDVSTRAHLDDLRSRVETALKPQTERS